MIHQRGLQTIHLSNLRGIRIDPIDHRVFFLIFEGRLMLGTKAAKQENAPVIVVFFPPLEINMEGSGFGRFDQAEGVVCHKLIPFIQSEIEVAKMFRPRFNR